VELFPRYWEPFHSDNAYQQDGDRKYRKDGRLRDNLVIKTSTNNFTQTAVREIDHLINQYREEESLERITELSHQLSEMIHEHGVWVPAWKKPWLRIGHWNWIKFPEDWGPKETRDYEEFQVFWIDQSEKKAILKAKLAGDILSDQPTVRIYDKYQSN
jgi:microcin C transport system substrate-binding protein